MRQSQTVPKDPLLSQIFIALIINLIISGIFLWLLVTEINFSASETLSEKMPIISSFFVILCLYVSQGVLYGFLVTSKWRQDRRRQNAAESMLARRQRVLDPSISPSVSRALLISIVLRPRYRLFIPFGMLTALAVAGLLFAFLYATGDEYIRSRYLFSPAMGAIFAIYSVGIASIVAIGIALRVRQTIKISETGLVSNKIEIGGAVAWKDVILFARVHTYISPIIKVSRIATYELSTRSAVMRFSVLTKSARFVRPNVPWEEYERQVHEMFDLIEAKTGLELVDVR